MKAIVDKHLGSYTDSPQKGATGKPWKASQRRWHWNRALADDVPESGIFSGRSSRSRGSEMGKACSVREDRGIVVRITEGAGRKTEAQRGAGIGSKQVSLR